MHHCIARERVEVPLQFGITVQKVTQQAMNEDGQNIFEVLWQAGEGFCIASWASGEAQRNGSVDLERRCQDLGREIQMLNKRPDIFQDAIEGKHTELKNERVKECRIELLKKSKIWYTDRTNLASSVDVPK